MNNYMNFNYIDYSYKKNTFDKFYGVYYGESALKTNPETITYLSNNILDNVNVSYFHQEQKTLNLNNTIIDEIWDSNRHLTQTEIRSMLGAFLFEDEDVFKQIYTLSGGERARVAILKLILSKANFLLLDEPTNHLDIDSKEVLEEALSNYTGTIFTISHDRYFLNTVVDKILVLDENGITEYLGNYDDYLSRTEGMQSEEAIVQTSKESKEKVNDYQLQKQKKAQERKRKNQLSKCEDMIAQLEVEIEELNVLMSDEAVASDYEKLSEITSTLEEKQAELENQYELWGELSSDA